ncbi:MAG: dihydropteroate synthase [Paraglaciecola sp.]|nr:dihydropteroate synthase [Paraglaciecola sp.]NCT48816.1 dihydropteroate synthase [Paraglaciecola sp.]
MQFKHSEIDLARPSVMGIVNVTPDSFSDGGRFVHLDAALRQVEQMLKDGATFIDVGGESTRPGAQAVSTEEELQRVIPLIEAIAQRFQTIISIDTSKAKVMREACQAGASFINDVRALQEEGALQVATEMAVPVCLMHMQGQPRSMQHAPAYVDVVNDVREFFQKRIKACVQSGIKEENLILDPGFGFGKTVAHNYQLLARLADLQSLGAPLLIGLSRKSMIGNLLQRDMHERLAGSLAGALIAAQQGAKIIRVHDVKETVDALRVLAEVEAYKENNNER